MALSGGLDSAVAASLLRRQGWDLTAIHLRLTPWSASEDWVEALAQRLDIPLQVIDLQEEFAREVLDYFMSEYARGRTPNPCVRCNAAIKFGRLWERLREDGYSHLATGHYARLQPMAGGIIGLLRGLDRRKDQSYFLSRLPCQLLPHFLFPLGSLTKDEVRRIYRTAGLPIRAGQQESVELCFIPEGNYQSFLRAQGEGVGPPGDFVDSQGRLLGQHRGLKCYTVGQRRGLGIPAREAFYVTEIQPELNRVVLGPRAELYSSGLLAAGVNWLISPPALPFEAVAVIRYRHPGVPARITPQRDGSVQVEFETPQSAVAPGQAVVFYDRDRVLGGGWIEARIK
ncbi:MAG: tRNA 2-thiouridine(34) synthase MnmA [Thermodesulfobacteriota bacterium]